MAKTIKSVKEKLANGSYGNPIPFGANGENIDLANGYDLETTLGNIEVEEKGTVQYQIDDANRAAKVTMTTDRDNEDWYRIYTFHQNNQEIGRIRIPNDMVVESGEVKYLETGEAGEGTAAGTYIILTLANADEDKLYINVGDLIQIYKAAPSAKEVQLAVDIDTWTISASLVDNGIAEIKLTQAVKEKLAKAVSAVQSITTGNTEGTIRVDGTDVKVQNLQSAAYKTVEQLIGWTDF